MNSNAAPSAAGVQSAMMTPFGMYKNPTRATGFAAVSAAVARAGTMPSSSGSANAAPTPRKNDRRGMAFLKIIMALVASSSEMECSR